MNHATDPPGAGVRPGYRADFAVSAHSARHLRRILRAYLADWGLLDVADAAELALTELVANVVRHVPGRRCQVLVLLRDRAVRVEVADGCPRPPGPVDGPLLGDGGRGLLLVEAVTDAWGVVPRAGGPGKTVWFECRAKAEGA